jgi:ubiquinone biosynthesis protein COQ9
MYRQEKNKKKSALVQENEKDKEKQLCLALLCLLCFLANWNENCFVGETLEQEGYSEHIELSFFFFLCVV